VDAVDVADALLAWLVSNANPALKAWILLARLGAAVRERSGQSLALAAGHRHN
jgi:hypothetical protein